MILMRSLLSIYHKTSRGDEELGLKVTDKVSEAAAENPNQKLDERLLRDRFFD